MAALRVCREVFGIIGRAGEKDGRVVYSARDQDNGVEFDAITHGNVHHATDIIELFSLRTTLLGISLGSAPKEDALSAKQNPKPISATRTIVPKQIPASDYGTRRDLSEF